MCVWGGGGGKEDLPVVGAVGDGRRGEGRGRQAGAVGDRAGEVPLAGDVDLVVGGGGGPGPGEGPVGRVEGEVRRRLGPAGDRDEDGVHGALGPVVAARLGEADVVAQPRAEAGVVVEDAEAPGAAAVLDADAGRGAVGAAAALEADVVEYDGAVSEEVRLEGADREGRLVHAHVCELDYDAGVGCVQPERRRERCQVVPKWS